MKSLLFIILLSLTACTREPSQQEIVDAAEKLQKETEVCSKLGKAFDTRGVRETVNEPFTSPHSECTIINKTRGPYYFSIDDARAVLRFLEIRSMEAK